MSEAQFTQKVKHVMLECSFSQPFCELPLHTAGSHNKIYLTLCVNPSQDCLTKKKKILKKSLLVSALDAEMKESYCSLVILPCCFLKPGNL